MGRVVSVNVGTRTSLDLGNRTVETGIGKRAASGPVHLGAEGLAADVVVDSAHHGGPDQAVYVYGAEDYAWWEGQLARSLPAGIFGENLTISAVDMGALRIGDRFQTAHVLLEVTAPRIPCSVLAAAMGDAGFVKRFREARRPGVYTRVLREGPVEAGDALELVPGSPEHVTVAEVYEAWYATEHDPAFVMKALASPLAQRTRERASGWG
ncbi:MAG: MOSC domain-containing protein [Alphaproteobacteria bacterium]|nr:MOSC domain-containing protein [Alphaproteobacteria bacterium]